MLKALEEGQSPIKLGSFSNSTILPSHHTPDESVQNVQVSNVPAMRCSCMALLNKEDQVPLEPDETLLSIYMNQLSPRFPFVIIPTGTTAEQLRTSRPLLMKVIRMVASVRHLQSIRGQSHEIIQHISQAMLTRSERSLDLLQGILVFLGFYHYHCMSHAQFNNLTQLAVSLVGDMELSSCPKSQERRNQLLPLIRCQDQKGRTNEERRALIGIWYMSSK